MKEVEEEVKRRRSRGDISSFVLFEEKKKKFILKEEGTN
jgi:hypothetical protein